MAYETSLNAPSEVNQGEEVRIEANIECLASSGQCSTQTFEIEIDGVVVKSDSYALRAGSSVSRGVGRGESSDVTLETDEWVITNDWSGDIVFKEPGNYTVRLTGTDGTDESQVLTVEDATDPDLVSADCSVYPDRITLGETTTVAATISNDNEGEATVDVTFELADASETLTVDVGGGETEQAEVTFEPVDTGEYTPEIEYDIV